MSTHRLRRRATRFIVGSLVAVLGVAGLGLGAGRADAHPLGNLSVNHYHGLVLAPHLLVDEAVVDTAEIPTAQADRTVDADGDGKVSPTELDAYGRQQCLALQAAVSVTVGEQKVALALSSSSFVYRPGQAGLPTSRLECRLEAPLDVSVGRSTVVFADGYLADRVGWHEITARGDGVTLVDPSVPSTSITDRLDHYPTDLLASPLDVRHATLVVQPAAASASNVPTAAGSSTGAPATTAAPAARAGRRFSIEALGPLAGVVERINRGFNDLAGRRQLTVGIGLVAIALALLLGASHAVLPGHGKTVMAAYIAGRQGSVRDAVLVGATVTATHTGGVLVLGLALSVSTTLAGEVVLGWLGVVSGLLITVLGLSLLWGASHRRELSWGGHRHGPGGHTHNQHHPHTHDHDHPYDHDHGHDHDHPHHKNDHDDDQDHDHDHGPGPLVVAPARTSVALAERGDRVETKVVSRRGLVGMGIAGGLVPSPSALVVLLSAIALGRTVFGVALVIAYGVGMASTLTLAGILLVRVRDRYQRRAREKPGRVHTMARRWTRLAPFATAALVVVVGLGLALRSLALV